jgi:hypothetical protein
MGLRRRQYEDDAARAVRASTEKAAQHRAAKRGRKMFSALRAFHNGNRNVTNFVTK